MGILKFQQRKETIKITKFKILDRKLKQKILLNAKATKNLLDDFSSRVEKAEKSEVEESPIVIVRKKSEKQTLRT